jgi:hypothetical protein
VEDVAMSNRMRYMIGIFVAASLMGCTQGKLTRLRAVQTLKPFEKISLEITDYKPTAGRDFKHIFVSNFSVKVDRSNLEYSAARDGLYDTLKTSLENQYGFALDLPDWNGDGFSDLLMYLSGITYANQSTLFCSSMQRTNSANDGFSYTDRRLSSPTPQFLGLRDCEKSFLQLNANQFDFDKDGIPDYLEIRNGLNPKNVADANVSASADGIPNIEKVKRNIPVDEDGKAEANAGYAYEYKTDLTLAGIRTFNIKNIPILRGGVDNFIAIYLTEVDPATQQTYLYSAYIVIDRAMSNNSSIRFPFWANTPSASFTNQEILE